MKFDNDRNKEKIRFEEQALFFGDLQSIIANCNRDTKKKPKPFNRHDFYEFSFYKKEKEKMSLNTLSPKEVKDIINGK